MDGGGDGVTAQEDGSIDAGRQVVDNGVVKQRVGFRGVVDRRQWRSSGAATRRQLSMTCRRKFVVVECYVAVIVFVGESFEGGRSG